MLIVFVFPPYLCYNMYTLIFLSVWEEGEACYDSRTLHLKHIHLLTKSQDIQLFCTALLIITPLEDFLFFFNILAYLEGKA